MSNLCENSAFRLYPLSFFLYSPFKLFTFLNKKEKLNFNKKLEWGGGGGGGQLKGIDVDVDHLTCCFLYFFCFRFLLNRFNVKEGTAHI